MAQKYCKHKEDSKNKSELEKIMESLPDNQGGEGRHKCPYCAYEEGYKKGLENTKKQIEQLEKRFI